MKARILLNYDWDWAGTEASLKRAIDLSPGLAFAYETYCWLLLGQGRRDEALAAARKTVTLDPRSSYMAFTEGRVLYRVRRYREAEDAYKRAIDLDPGFPNPYSGLALLYTTERRFAEAREMLDRKDRLPSARPDQFPRALLEAASGNKARAKEFAKTGGPVLRSRIHLAFGDYDAAFSTLDEAIDERAFNIANWADPDFDVVRSDLRFARAVERTGIVAAPLVVWGTWPDRK